MVIFYIRPNGDFCVSSDNPDFRYVVGKDAAMMLEAKNMSDREFQSLMKKQFNLQDWEVYIIANCQE